MQTHSCAEVRQNAEKELSHTDVYSAKKTSNFSTVHYDLM